MKWPSQKKLYNIAHILFVPFQYIFIIEETKQTLEMHKSSEFIRFFETYFCGCQGPLLGLQPQSDTLLDNLLHMATVFIG